MARRRSSSGGRAPAAIHATFVPRRGTPSDGHLLLWGPERPNRFPWATALERLGLPVDEDLQFQQGSARLVLPREGRFRITTTHGVLLSAADVVRLLGPARFGGPDDASGTDTSQRGRRRYRPTAALTAWSVAAKLALELVARQSFVPNIRRGAGGSLHAVWTAAVEASHDVGRVRRLATDMPAAAHALLQPMPRRWRDRRGRGRRRRRAPRVWHPELLVRSFLDAAIDALVRERVLNAELDDGDGLAELVDRIDALAAIDPPGSPWDVRQAGLIDLGEDDDEDEDDEDGDDDELDDDDLDDDDDEDEQDDDDEDGDDSATRSGSERGSRADARRRSDDARRRRRNGLLLSDQPLAELRTWEYRWLCGLVAPRDDAEIALHHDDPRLLKELGDWLSWVLGRGDGPAKEVDSRTGLWLEMPEDATGEEVYWYLRYMLVAADDPSLAVPAQQVFGVGSSRLRVLDHSFDRPQEKLLTELGYASTLFEPIKSSLEQPRPEGVYLDARSAWKFISEAGPVLYAAGFDVRLPEELTGQGQRRLRARLRIRDASSAEGGGDDTKVGLSDLAAFQWEAALGDEVISADEFKQIAGLKQPLVRWRGTWVLVDPVQLKSIEELLENARAHGTMSRFEALSRALTGVADPTAPSSDIEVIVEGRIAELVETMSSEDLLEEEIDTPETFHGELRPYQSRGLAWLVYQSKLGLGCCLADDMGLGKAQPLDARILTPTGWTTMGEVRVGDEVIGASGQPVRVTGVYPQGEKDIFRVVFSDGAATECCDEHLWAVNSPTRRHRGQPPHVRPLSAIREHLVDAAGNRQHFIPMVAPVQFAEGDAASRPIDGYLLGALLGDGGLSQHSVAGDGPGVPNPLTHDLRGLGLMGTTSETKFVPESYKIAPVDVRHAVLQGLLDTDGHVRPADNNVEFSTVSRQLAEDVSFLVQSLGGTAPIREKTTTYTHAGERRDGRLAYRMSIALPGDFAPFRLTRKADVYQPRSKYPPSRSIASVEYVGRKRAQCIAVEADDSLYVTDDLIVTHNTIQLIAELLYHAEQAPNDKRGTLLVCPTSVVGNWQRELARFGPELTVKRHHGADRAQTLEELEHEMREPNTVLVTTYGLARRDVDLLKQRRWARFVLDEAQAIKNVASQRSQAVREIDAEFRVALTGTPIENRLSELWSVLDFLNPGLLGTHEKFRRAYALPIERYQDPDALERLRRLVGPFIMRRVKTDPNIIQDLPEKLEMKVYCTLTREQASLYQALVDAAMAEIESSEGIARHGRVLALLTQLKQVVDHPNLYLRDDDVSERRSGKLTRLVEMLESVVDTGDRALIFTQFKKMGDLLVARLQEQFDVDVPFLHGGVPQAARDVLVDRFQDEDGPPFFVLSLKAGGTGLNLTAANHVFHFDRWWNPAVEDQATDRAFRIGQTRNVQVHKMVSLGTLEEKIDTMLTEKRNLAETIVDSSGAWVTELDTNALRDLVSLGSDATVDDAD